MAVIAETPRKIDLDCTVSKDTISNCTILKPSIQITLNVNGHSK